MIQITADGKLVYDSRLDEYTMMTLTTTTALNKGGTAVLTMPPGHPAYMDFIEYKTIVEVFRDGGLVYRGRVLYLEDGASNERTVTCEGELCFFHDAIHRPYLYQKAPGEIFQAVLDVYNQQVAEAQKQFRMGKVTVTDPNEYIRMESENAESTLDVLNKLLERCGGYFVFSTDEDGSRVISWLNELTGYSKQEITLENTLNFSRAGINTSIATAVLPYGAKDEETGQRLTISSVNNGVDYIVDEEAKKFRGFICRTETWDDVTLPENLLAKAKKWLDENKLIVTSISLTAMDLSLMDKSIDCFRVGDSILVRIPAYGLDDRFRLTEKTEDLLIPSGSQITLGKEVRSLTGADVAGDNEASNELHEVAEVIKKDYTIGISQAVQKSKTELETMINQTSEEIKLMVSRVESSSVTGTVNQYYLSTSKTKLSGGTWSEVAPEWTEGKYMWSRTKTTKGDGSVSYSAPTCIAGATGPQGVPGLQGPKGDRGIQGPKGADGKTSYTHIAYANSADGATDFTVSDSNRAYIGMYVDFSETDSTNPGDYAWSKIKGADGANGTPGKAGADGKTPYFHVAYANNATGTSGFSTTDSTNKLYIGQYTDYTQADSTDPKKYAWTKIKGDKGDTGESGVGVKSIDVQYYLSTSSTTLTGGSWSTTAPTWVNGKYMWSKTVTTLSNGGVEESKPVCITGAKGSTGTSGTTITSITEQYYLSTSKTQQTGGSWVEKPPAWSAGKYLWTRSKIIYANPTKTEYTTPVCDSSWEAVNEVQVGGRNLQLGTQFWDDTCIRLIGNAKIEGEEITIPAGTYTELEKIQVKNGEVYTIGCDVKSDVAYDGNSFLVQFFNEAGTRLSYEWATGSIGTDWSRVVKTLRVTRTESPLFLGIGLRANSGVEGVNCTLTYRHMMVERGNRATDWAPAQTDVESQITTTSRETAELVLSKSSIWGEVTEVTERVSDVEGTLKEAEKKGILNLTAENLSIKFTEALKDANGVHIKGKNFDFDTEGLSIANAGKSMRNLLDEEGMEVTRDGESILSATKDGVNAIDLTARQYLVIGENARFEDYGTGRTACYWIGG